MQELLGCESSSHFIPILTCVRKIRPLAFSKVPNEPHFRVSTEALKRVGTSDLPSLAAKKNENKICDIYL